MIIILDIFIRLKYILIYIISIMSSSTYLKRVLENPKFILNQNFILHPLSSIKTAKTIINNNLEIFDALSILTNTDTKTISNYFEEISTNTSLLDHIKNEFMNFHQNLSSTISESKKFFKDNPAGRLGRDSQPLAGFFLYCLVRSLKPEIFVETGVSAGESSSFILQAMEDNKKGKLYSIDFPQAVVENGLTTIIPQGKESGWIIPEHLKHRWNLTLGKSEDVLLPLLQNLKKIDIFFHDSLHTYDHMMFEYQTCWDYLNDSGILISDDIVVLNGKGHSPFVDFAEIKKKKIVVYNIVGGIKK
jgi:predicted O-methyltransferase YrrM